MTTNQLQEYYEEVAKQKWPNATKREVTLEIIIRDFGMHQYKVSFYAEFLNEEPEKEIEIPGFIPKGIAESTRKQIIKILSNIQS